MLPVTPVHNVSIHRVQNAERGRCFASRGVTTEDLRVGHGTTRWTAFISTKALPRVRWVTNFKVECRRPGYVDDPTG